MYRCHIFPHSGLFTDKMVTLFLEEFQSGAFFSVQLVQAPSKSFYMSLFASPFFNFTNSYETGKNFSQNPQC